MPDTRQFSLTPAGTNGDKNPAHVVEPDGVPNAQATATEIGVRVIGKDGQGSQQLRRQTARAVSSGTKIPPRPPEPLAGVVRWATVIGIFQAS
ncbi:MAG: hypothetical protein ABJC26_13865 [Gemmatimonadaceae bacterium]